MDKIEPIKLVSWNVNGLRACLSKGFFEFFHDIQADIFCIQESKLSEGQLDLDLPGYQQYFNFADKKGYSGTAVFTRHQPLNVAMGLGIDRHDREGRLITLEYNTFYLVNVYTPNAQRGLQRLDYRMEWEDAFRRYVHSLQNHKPVVICGDLNVAHREIDLKNPKTNRRNAGFTDEERGKLSQLLEAGFVDSYRHFHPDREDAYTWWSYFANARERNIGWRIDYFLVSEGSRENLQAAAIYPAVFGSDHCPVGLTIATAEQMNPA